MDTNPLILLAIIGALLLVPALVAGLVFPQAGEEWPARIRHGFVLAGLLICAATLAAGWWTFLREQQESEAVTEASELALPRGPAPVRPSTPPGTDFLVTLVLRDNLLGDEPVLMEQVRVSPASAVRGSVKNVTLGNRDYVWRVMVNPPRVLEDDSAFPEQPTWTLVGSAAFVPKGTDPIRQGAPYGLALSDQQPFNHITRVVAQPKPPFGFLVAADSILLATMFFEPLASGTTLREASPEEILRRYGSLTLPAHKWRVEEEEETPMRQGAVAMRLVRFLHVAAGPLAAGVILLGFGFRRHRTLAMAGICAALLGTVALNERIALRRHLSKMKDADAPLAVRISGARHAAAVFFWQETASGAFQAYLEKTDATEPVSDLIRELSGTD